MHIENNTNAILFDLDGTLTDPKLGITSCIQYAMKKLAYPVPHVDELLWCIGPSLKVSFARLLDSSDDTLKSGVELSSSSSVSSSSPGSMSRSSDA